MQKKADQLIIPFSNSGIRKIMRFFWLTSVFGYGFIATFVRVSCFANDAFTIANEKITRGSFSAIFYHYPDVKKLELLKLKIHPSAWMELPQTLQELVINEVRDHQNGVIPISDFLAAFSRLKSLKKLTLQRNAIDSHGAQKLAQIKGLTHLDLSWNQMGIPG